VASGPKSALSNERDAESCEAAFGKNPAKTKNLEQDDDPKKRHLARTAPSDRGTGLVQRR